METSAAQLPGETVVTENPTKAHLVIDSRSNTRPLINPKVLWAYRELMMIFVWRDLKLRYKQTALGASWTVIQPALTCGIFSFFFGKLAKMPSDGIPYPVFVFVAILPWNFFSSCLVKGSYSLVASGNLISKIYFPRSIIPFGAQLPAVVDYAIGLSMLVPLFLYFGIGVSPVGILAVVGLSAAIFAFSLGLALWLSAINLKYRDVGNILPFVLQMWMFATPIVYPLSIIPSEFRWVATINPMSGIIAGFRSALLGVPWDFPPLFIGLGVALAVLFTGAFFFRRQEVYFADSL